MALLDALNAQHIGVPVRCPIAKIRQQLEPGDIATLDTALGNPAMTAKAIANALTTIGHKTSHEAVARHRRKVCACDPR